MEQNRFLKLFCVLAFLAFATVSCWATAESLHLLLPSFPLVMCWIVTVGFFFIASWGTKMIVDSLNQQIYMDKRGLSLIGGILILIVFWLICSMPTNTHTFFYRNVINDKVTDDISLTKSYLAQIKDNIVTDVDANIMVDNNVNAIDIIEFIKLPKKPGLITLSDYDIYDYFHNSGNWKAEIFRFIGKIDFGNLKERIGNTKKMYICPKLK